MQKIVGITAIAIAALFAGCSSPAGDANSPPENGAATEQSTALEDIVDLYEEAMKLAPDDPVEWAKDDIQKIGDWEYRVVVHAKAEPAELEAVLNEYGAERWEVFWVSESLSKITFYLKKPARSYLRMVPVSSISEALGTPASAAE